MTLLMLAAEIQIRIINNQPFKRLYGEKTTSVYLEFYEDSTRSITYKVDAHDFEKIKELINYEKILL